MGRPVVAIVGRPNVGKSTLFNRLVGHRQAVVDDMPGVTRDRMMGEAEWAGRRFFVVDTGGLFPEATRGLDAQVRRQVEAALDRAAAVLLLMDVETGLTGLDEQIARVVRASGRPVLLAVNKADSEAKEIEAAEFARLGFGEPHVVSALHGRSTGDLLDALVALLPPPAPRDDAEAAGGIRVAIVGRPNTGNPRS
jgi:GTP-binding protein